MTAADPGTRPLRRARIAVAVLFLGNGVIGAAWLPRLAEIQSRLSLDDGTLGVALAFGAIGGLLIGPLAGPLVGRWGSARVAVVAFVAFAPVLVGLAAAPGPVLLAATLLWLGAGDAVMDASMNAHALRVQAGYRRSIINSFHGYWSVGAVTGGVLGSVSLAVGIPLAPFLLGVAAVALVVVLVTAGWLLPAPDPQTHLEDEAAPGVLPEAGAFPVTGRRISLTRATLLLGAFTLLAVVVEDVPARWSSVYMTDVGAAAGAVGIAYVAFTAAQTIGRFLGDRVVDRFGEVTVVRASMAAVAVVTAVGLVVGTPIAYVVLSAVTGLGVATLFPAAMHAAAHLPGTAPAAGVAVVSWLARAGFVIAPIVVGGIADAFGIGWGVATTVVAAAALIPVATVLRAGATPSAPGARPTR